MSSATVSPAVTAVARRLATTMGSGAACCIATTNDSGGWSMQCGVGGTRRCQSTPGTTSEQPCAARLQSEHQGDLQHCEEMLADLIEGDMEGTHVRCQPGWMTEREWVDFWSGIQPASRIKGAVQAVVSCEGKFAPTPATHAALLGADGREWHVQACWNGASITGLWVTPLADRAELTRLMSAASCSSPPPPAPEGVPLAHCEIGDRWHLGSCGKAMASTLLAIFVEDGILRWDSTLASTVSDVFGGGELPNGYGGISLLQLLNQTSGVRGNPCPPDEMHLAWALHGAGEPPKEQRRGFCRAFMTNVPLLTAPGANPKHVYSNVNFTLAALMVEEATDRAWEELMVERLFAPLGMSSAGFGAPGAGEDLAARQRHPWPHAQGSDGKMKPVDPVENHADNPHVLTPAGRVHCSLEDWGRYLAVHLNHNVASEKLGLSHSTMEVLEGRQLRESLGTDYAGGWLLCKRHWASCAEDSSGWTLSHGGSNTMNFCQAWLAPAKGLAVFVCCNSSPPSASSATDEAIVELLRLQGAL